VFSLAVIFLCCCIRFRIPRTKQEIEADYVRKKLTKKFQKQLRVIQNSELDNMDLKRGTVQPCSDFGSRACVISTVGREAQVLEIQDHRELTNDDEIKFISNLQIGAHTSSRHMLCHTSRMLLFIYCFIL
jgi:hypothetical protein